LLAFFVDNSDFFGSDPLVGPYKSISDKYSLLARRGRNSSQVLGAACSVQGSFLLPETRNWKLDKVRSIYGKLKPPRDSGFQFLFSSFHLPET
jgi:hypothetical protein